MFQEQVSSFSPVQIHMKTCHEILVLELIGDSCTFTCIGESANCMFCCCFFFNCERSEPLSRKILTLGNFVDTSILELMLN